MKKSIAIITLLIVGFLASSVLITGCNSKKTEQEQKEAEDHENAEGKDHDDVVYACSMHPEVTGKEGDKCSKCGMKLELVKKADTTKVHEGH